MLKRKLLIVTAGALMALTLSACGKTENTDETTDANTVHYGETIKNGDVELSYGVEDNSDADDKPSAEEQIEIRLGVLDGAQSLAFVSLMDRNAAGLTNERYKTEVYKNPDIMTEKIVNGDIDAAALPVDTAAKLYNDTEGGVKVIAISTLSNLYIAENGSSVSSVEDLAGKTVYSAGKNTMPQYVLEAVLKNKGITDCKIEYKASYEELCDALVSGEAAIAVLPQPYLAQAAAKNANIKTAVDLSDDWSDAAKSDLVTGCVVVTKNLLQNHADAVKYLLKDCQSSLNLANYKTDEIAELAVQYSVTESAENAKNAIKGADIAYFDQQKMKNMVNNVCVALSSFNTEAVGGKLPDAAFYYVTDEAESK